MSAEEFLSGFAKFASYLLPIVGVVVLIYLVILMKKLIETLKELDKTMVLVDDQVKKLDEPLATVQQLSASVDDMHNKTRDVLKNASHAAEENISKAKIWWDDRQAKAMVENPHERKALDEVADTVKETVLTVCDNVRERINEKKKVY